MTNLTSAQVASRSNTALFSIETIMGDRAIDSAVRAEAVYRVMQSWDRATADSTGRRAARKLTDSIFKGMSWLWS